MKTSIKDIDHGWRGIFRRAMGAAQEKKIVAVGVQGAKAEEDHGGISNVRLAGVHEFGAEIQTARGVIKIPERSFIRSTVDEHGAYREEVSSLAAKVLTGALNVTRALSILGEKVSSDIKSKIENGIDPPNAQSTIDAKGSSVPLIDTAQMKNSITYQVKNASDGDE